MRRMCLGSAAARPPRCEETRHRRSVAHGVSRGRPWSLLGEAATTAPHAVQRRASGSAPLGPDIATTWADLDDDLAPWRCQMIGAGAWRRESHGSETLAPNSGIGFTGPRVGGWQRWSWPLPATRGVLSDRALVPLLPLPSFQPLPPPLLASLVRLLVPPPSRYLAPQFGALCGVYCKQAAHHMLPPEEIGDDAR